MKKIFVVLVAIVGLGLSANAQKAYNTEDALAKGMVELFASIDKISVDEWVNSLMPNYKLAKQLGVDVTKYYFPETDKDAIDFLKELYSDLLFPAPPYNINLFRVKEVYQLKTAGSILNSAFEYDFFSFEHYLDIFNTSYAYFYIAEYNGIPAGACMVLHGEDFMEIAWAGTLNGYRKKGIAGYLLNMAEKDAVEKGIPISVLSAFPGGVNAYSRVGYRKICEIKIICYNPA